MIKHVSVSRTLMSVLAVMLAGGIFWSCRAHSETLNTAVNDYKTLKLSVGVNVTYVQGPLKPVSVTGNKEYVKYVNVKHDGSTLEISYRTPSEMNVRGSEVSVVVQAPDVTEFDLSVGAALSITKPYRTSGDVEFNVGTGAVLNVSGVEASEIELDCSTGSSARVTGIKASSVELDCSTGATAYLAGTTSHFEVDCSTGAVVKAEHLRANRGSVKTGTGAQVNSNIRNLLSNEKGFGATINNSTD